MPSNKDLANEAHNLADELGLSIETDGLKNDGLVDLVSDLRAKKKDAENNTQADEAEKADVEAVPTDAKPAVASGPVVAEGRSVTTKRGIIGGGQRIALEDLSGGKASFDKLVKAGVIKG